MTASERSDDSAWVRGSLMSSLAARDQEVVLQLGRARRYAAGEMLFRQGDPSDFVVVIIEGYVKISAVADDGAQTLLAVRMAGDVVGELAAIDGIPRSATVRAAVMVLARVIMKPEFERCLAENYAVARALNRAVSSKLRMATRRRVDFRSDTRSRLARLLVDLYHCSARAPDDGTYILGVTQAELAGLIGASEGAVHKALRALRDAHAVRTRYGRTAIENIAVLQRIAEGGRPEIEGNIAELHIFTRSRGASPLMLSE